MGRKVLCTKKKGSSKDTDSGFTVGNIYEVDELGVINDHGSVWDSFLNTMSGDYPAEKWVNWTKGISSNIEFIVLPSPIRRF